MQSERKISKHGDKNENRSYKTRDKSLTNESKVKCKHCDGTNHDFAK